MKKLSKAICLCAIFYLAGCSKDDPTCMPFEGIIVQGKNGCLGDKTVMQITNKKVNSIYYDGKDTLQNVVAAAFPDTASLQTGQKVYFDFESLKEPYLVCFSLQAFPVVQVKITRLSYRPCSGN